MARDRDDDYTDDPPRRRRDEDDYPDVRRPRQLTGLDATFANTNMVLLVLFGFCCGGVALILGIVGLVVCKDEVAWRNALIVTIISGFMSVVHGGVGVFNLTR